MANVPKRQQPATHPTVWIGLAFASVGLMLAVYSYTGTRIYDVRFALVAFSGGFLALVGILLSAWGRSIMAARAQRARRAGVAPDRSVPVEGASPPPTVAAPREKRRFSFGLKAKKEAEPAKPAAVFAFRRREPAAAVAVEAPREEPARERFTLKCPACAHEFTAEGVRPLSVSCPSCAHSGVIQ